MTLPFNSARFVLIQTISVATIVLANGTATAADLNSHGHNKAYPRPRGSGHAGRRHAQAPGHGRFLAAHIRPEAI